VEGAFHRAKIDGLMHAIFCQTRKASVLQRLLDLRRIGISQRSRLELPLIAKRLHEDRCTKHFVLGDEVSEARVCPQRNQSIGEDWQNLAVLVPDAVRAPIRFPVGSNTIVTVAFITAVITMDPLFEVGMRLLEPRFKAALDRGSCAMLAVVANKSASMSGGQ